MSLGRDEGRMPGITGSREQVGKRESITHTKVCHGLGNEYCDLGSYLKKQFYRKNILVAFCLNTVYSIRVKEI